MNYSFFADQGETPETLAERRRIADLIAGRIGDGPRNIGGGIGDLFAGLAAGLSRYRTSKMQKAGDASYRPGMDNLMKLLSGQNIGQPGDVMAAASRQPVEQVPELATYTPPQAAQGPQNAGLPNGQPEMAAQPIPEPMATAPMQPAEPPQAAQMQPANNDAAVMQQIMELLDNPFVPAQDREFLLQRYEGIQKKQDPMYALELEYKKAQINNLNKPDGGNSAEYGLQPIITQEPPGPNGEPGKYHLFQAAKDGSPPKEIPLPYGWTPQQQYLDTGLGYQAAPRQGVGNGAVIPKNVFEEAATKEGGKNSEGVPAMVAQDYLKPGGMKEQDDATISSISAIHEARKMLDRGIQTGALADKLQSLRSIGDALGFEVDERVLTDTQTYQNFIRQTVIPKMKELGGNDSNEELRKMELLSGADIKQQDQTIRNTLDLTEKLLAKKFKSRELYRKATKKYFGDVYEIPELPTYNATPMSKPFQGGPKVIDGYTIRRIQ